MDARIRLTHRCLSAWCAGAYLDRSGIDHKLNVLTRAWKNYSGDGSVSDLMAWFGGYEMAMAVGGMLRAAERGMVIIVDGFIMTSCMLAASRLYPEVTEYAVYGHQGDESSYRLALEALEPCLCSTSTCALAKGAAQSAPIPSFSQR